MTFEQANAAIEKSKDAHIDSLQLNDPENASSNQCINVGGVMQERRNATILPVNVSLGRFHEAHPIAYSTSLSETTSLKDLSSGSYMVQETRFARAVDRSISLQAMDSREEGESIGIFESELSRISMSIKENVTEGQAHLGVLQGSDKRGDVWRDPSLEIDQDYFGTFQLQTNTSLGQPQETLCLAEGWMPCCLAGYLSMPECYRKAVEPFGSRSRGFFASKISTPLFAQGSIA
jgi:hypothetical protein